MSWIDEKTCNNSARRNEYLKRNTKHVFIDMNLVHLKLQQTLSLYYTWRFVQKRDHMIDTLWSNFYRPGEVSFPVISSSSYGIILWKRCQYIVENKFAMDLRKCLRLKEKLWTTRRGVNWMKLKLEITESWYKLCFKRRNNQDWALYWRFYKSFVWNFTKVSLWEEFLYYVTFWRGEGGVGRGVKG